MNSKKDACHGIADNWICVIYNPSSSVSQTPKLSPGKRLHTWPRIQRILTTAKNWSSLTTTSILQHLPFDPTCSQFIAGLAQLYSDTDMDIKSCSSKLGKNVSWYAHRFTSRYMLDAVKSSTQHFRVSRLWQPMAEGRTQSIKNVKFTAKAPCDRPRRPEYVVRRNQRRRSLRPAQGRNARADEQSE
jgi:hypothetical protein